MFFVQGLPPVVNETHTLPTTTTRTSSWTIQAPTRYIPEKRAPKTRTPHRMFPISQRASPMLVKFGKAGASLTAAVDSATILQDIIAESSDTTEPRWSHTPLPYKDASVLFRPHFDNIGRSFTDKNASMTFEIVDICVSTAPAPDIPMITYKYYDTSVFSSPPHLTMTCMNMKESSTF